MVKRSLINNYKFLILILLIIIVFQFVYIVILKLKKLRKRKKLNSINDLYSIIIPLDMQIKNLQKDKENYQKTLSRIEKEVKLYSEEILNIIDTGVLLTDKDKNIIYKNNWFEVKQIETSKIINLNHENIEFEIQNRNFEIKKQEYENITVYTINDITEIKELEKEIQMKEKLAYLGEMSASIAHEFKNSLTAIKGFASALKRKSDNQAIVLKISQNIEEEVDYFHKILTDYLNYSKNINLNKKTLDFKSFIEEVIKNNFSENNIILNIADNTTVLADEDKLKQVMINLIKNSLEASPFDEKIIIETKSKDNKTIIKIKDFGKGMDKETMKKIFNPFFTTKSTGTGLGTSISYQIIKAHNGVLKYEKNAPKGTITTIIL